MDTLHKWDNDDEDDDDDNNTNKYKTYFTGEITLRVAQVANTEQLQHCTLETCFVSST